MVVSRVVRRRGVCVLVTVSVIMTSLLDSMSTVFIVNVMSTVLVVHMSIVGIRRLLVDERGIHLTDLLTGERVQAQNLGRYFFRS